MTEEFDAIQTLNLTTAILAIFTWLALAIVLEVGLRLAKRWAVGKGQDLLGVIFNAFTWQPFFWTLIIGVALPSILLLDQLNLRRNNQGPLVPLITISVTIVAVRLLRGWLGLIKERKPSVSVSLLNYLIMGGGIVIISTIIFAYIFNIPTQSLFFTLFLGIFGLFLAFRDPINNIFSGIFLTLSNRLNRGDFVRLPSGNEGQVIDIQWDVTSVRQFNDVTTIVPNTVISSAEIINYAQPEPQFKGTIDIGISYKSDLEHVEQVTLEVAEHIMLTHSKDNSLAERPFIRYTGFAASNITFRLYLPVSRIDEEIMLKHRLVKQLHERYGKEGITIAFQTVIIDSFPQNSHGRDQENLEHQD